MRFKTQLFSLLLVLVSALGFAQIDAETSTVVSSDALISDPLQLAFAADRSEHFIDVIDLGRGEVVYRIDTPFLVDDMVVTPYAPLLFYTNIENRVLVAYNLATKEIDREINLPITPRHLVLDPSGKNIGISDSVAGGIVIVSTYGREIVHSDKNFPATTDVLFDPNEIDLHYVNNGNGALGLLDLNTYESFEVGIVEQGNSNLSSPSRSLDGRYLYLSDWKTGNVIVVDAYSREIKKTFNTGGAPARPYTTPQGAFLYMLDQESGRFVAASQKNFSEYIDTEMEEGIDLVAVGRFDRLNLLSSSRHKKFYLFDNLEKALISSGEFSGTPFDILGSIDGQHAYVAFGDLAQVGVIDLESQELQYIPTTNNGSGAFVLGATNNVCH